MNRKDIKKLAKNKLKNNLGILIMISLIIIISVLAAAFTVGKDIMPLVICNAIILVSIGSGVLTNISLKIVKDENVGFKEAFSILKNVDKIIILDFIKYCATSLFVVIFSLPLGLAIMYAIFVSYDFMMLIIVCLLYMLLIILTYLLVSVFMSQKNYIISDFEDIKTFRVLGLNATFLRKNILKYIGFELSLLGWFVISVLTCGIGFLFLIPYRQICLAYFYESIKEGKLIEYKPSKNNKIIKVIIVLVIVGIANSIGVKCYLEMSEDIYSDLTDYGYVNIESEVKKVEVVNIEAILEEDLVSTGNNSQICRIISYLEGNAYFSKLENTYEEPPYKMKIYYSGNKILGLDDYMDYWDEENTNRILLNNAIVLMAMADDLEQIEFILEEKENGSYTFTRNEINDKCGMDVSKLRKDKKLLKEKLS